MIHKQDGCNSGTRDILQETCSTHSGISYCNTVSYCNTLQHANTGKVSGCKTAVIEKTRPGTDHLDTASLFIKTDTVVEWLKNVRAVQIYTFPNFSLSLLRNHVNPALGSESMSLTHTLVFTAHLISCKVSHEPTIQEVTARGDLEILKRYLVTLRLNVSRYRTKD